jgi:tRNA (guanine-N7-)-methyltransferase
MSDSPHFRRKLYGRRKGPRLSVHQARLMDEMLPQLLLPLEHGRDPRAYFTGRVTDVWLEIGFGGGEHLLWQAETHPDVGIIGAEPYVSGVGKLLSKLRARSSAGEEGQAEGPAINVRLYTEDAREIVSALPGASIGRVFILFPDPWPKARHHKRRFIRTEMLDELARAMRTRAELRFATDDRSYLLWALERLVAHPAFAWLAASPSDWRARPPDWPQTRYEPKAIRQGRRCTYLRFMRR